MYPRFSDLLNDLFGISINLPVQTYGFFVALAFIVAGFLVYFELKRKETSGVIPVQLKQSIKGRPASFSELFFAGILFFVVGFKLIGFLIEFQLFTENPQRYIFSVKGSLTGGIAFFLIAVILVYCKGQKEKLHEPVTVLNEIHAHELTPVFLILAAFTGILGAKIFDIIENLNIFFSDPVGMIFSFSGLTFYGGLITAAFAVGIYGEYNKIKWPVMADAVAPALMLAYAIGRIGCQLSGDGCWGVPNLAPKPGWMSFLPDWMWAFDFPHNVINHGVRISGCEGDFCFVLGQPVFPTSFYETMICLLFFLFLWFIRKKINIPGLLFSIYLFLNGVERFVIEEVRINIKYHIFGFQISQAQFIAVIFLIAGLAGSIYFYFHHYKLTSKNAKSY